MFFGFMIMVLLLFFVARSFAWARRSSLYDTSAYHYRSLPQQPPLPQPSAMEILRERYARGEIDTETFEAMAERLVRYENNGR